MVLLRIGMIASLTVLSLVRFTIAISLMDKLGSLSPGACDMLRRSTPASPRFVVYDDTWAPKLPTPTDLQGYNVFVLSFWLTSGATDMAFVWQEFTASERASYLQEYNAAGISLIVSAFGSTDVPTTMGLNPVTVADNLASWVVQYDLQGVDIDYEDFGAFNSFAGSAEPWLITLTRQLRNQLPQGQYILSHAPVAPWFSPGVWRGGGYLHIHESIGSLIDWYNIQFYNQGLSEYTTCDGLLVASSPGNPESALFQILANGVPQDKLLIGKPARPLDASSGYMSMSTFASCVAQAHAFGWEGGVMVWQCPHASSAWITAVRGDTF